MDILTGPQSMEIHHLFSVKNVLQTGRWLECHQNIVLTNEQLKRGTGGWKRVNRMDDLISRKAVLEELSRFNLHEDTITRLQMAVMKLPSVQPERKKGHWDDEHCSECGFYVYYGDMRNYCPCCGADMREGEQDG